MRIKHEVTSTDSRAVVVKCSKENMNYPGSGYKGGAIAYYGQTVNCTGCGIAILADCVVTVLVDGIALV